MEPAEAAGAGPLPPLDISGPAFLSSALAFGRLLKGEGMAADLATVLDYVRALELVDIGDRAEVRAAGAALFVRRRDELPAYERAFAAFWRRGIRRPRPSSRAAEPLPGEAPPGAEEAAQPRMTMRTATTELAQGAGDAEGEEADENAPSPMAWSAGERLRSTTFERMTERELREAERLIDAMAIRLPMRRTRRWDLHRSGALLAPRQMLRRNLATGGDP